MNYYIESWVPKGGLNLVDLTQTKYGEVAQWLTFN